MYRVLPFLVGKMPGRPLDVKEKNTTEIASYIDVVGHPLGDDHIRIAMEQTFLPPVWYPYFPVFCYFLRSHNSPSAHPLIVCITFKAELGHFAHLIQANT